jgi:GH35 family endo-1,4-beta-xylanase/acetyl esterase/lipase
MHFSSSNQACLAQAEHQAAEAPRNQHQHVTISPSPISLKQVVGSRYRLGVGVGQRTLQDPECAKLICKHFQILTPENCMKPQGIHPAEEEWNFSASDQFVTFIKENGLELVGHCLVWAKDDRTDDWMKREPDGTPVTRERLLARIKNHVATVVDRYASVATMWDVVNEALSDGDEGFLRDSIYTRTCGIDFIETAFRTAREHDPDALLIYNDYNGHFPNKRKKLIKLLKELKQRGVPVDAYGMQGHFELGDNSLDQLRQTFDELRELEIKVVVSELDIDVVKRGRWWADDGKYREELKSYDPYKNGLPRSIEQQQIDQYVALFRLFDEYQDIIARVTFWNLHDGQSWLNYFPWNRTNYPLLFGRDLQPKPAFDAVVSALQSKPKQDESPERLQATPTDEEPTTIDKQISPTEQQTSTTAVDEQETMLAFKVIFDPIQHGSIEIDPPLPEDGEYKRGTVVTVRAKPDEGYSLDSIYYSVPGRWGAMYHESLTPEFKITIDQEKHIGASFIESGRISHIDMKHNVVYAKPGKKVLKYDVYMPKGAKELPIVVIIHGGGWSTNDEDIMRGLARELTRSGKLVVCSIDYRWLGVEDGDDEPNTMPKLIEDVFGAIAHIAEHAEEYGGDANRIGVTGDSAGGHLSAAAAILVDRIGSRGFGRTEGVFEFEPTYLPKGASSADVRDQLLESIKAAAPSYGVFASETLGGFVRDMTPAAAEAVAPQSQIPNAQDRAVPHYLTRGTKDSLIRDEGVAAFAQALKDKGQMVIYDQVEDAGHAFFDWKPNEAVKATFAKYGVPYAAKMRSFFEEQLGAN